MTSHDRRGAILTMIGASALVAGTLMLAKILGLGGAGETGLHPFQVTAGRFVFALTLLGLFAARLRPSFAGAAWGTHAARSLCGWCGVTCMFAAAARIPLADATAISFLSPLVTMGLAIMLLGERIGPWRWAAAGIAVIGALILIRPGADTFQLASLIALASAGFMGLEAIFIKRLSDSEPPIRILVINNSIGAVIACAAAAFVWQAPSADQWALLALLGVTMAGAQSLFIQSMKREEAGYVIPFFYVTLLFAALYDFALYRSVPDPPALLGAGLIVFGVVLLAIRQRRAEQR